MTATRHVFDATTATFEAEVLQASLQTPILVDFWAEWCAPCKTLGPILETVAADYHGAFALAKVDTEAQPEIASAFQVRSLPTVFLVKDGQIADAFQGALAESQVREFLSHHGIQPAPPAAETALASDSAAAIDPHAEVVRLRKAVEAESDNAELKLDLALALLQTGGTPEAETLLDALPANLSTDDRAIKARARLGFAILLQDAPPAETLEAAIAAQPDNLRARHLLGVHRIVAGQPEAGLEQFLDMLRRDRSFDDALPRRALIDAFRIIDDDDLVGRYRRKMSSLLLV
ncbi:MAG: thioredoxin [Luteimonas sp.]